MDDIPNYVWYYMHSIYQDSDKLRETINKQELFYLRKRLDSSFNVISFWFTFKELEHIIFLASASMQDICEERLYGHNIDGLEDDNWIDYWSSKARGT